MNIVTMSKSLTPKSRIQLLQSNSLPSLVLQQLEKMILSGQFLPGEQLREIPLSEQIGVSRGPIREAFRGLEEKGLVKVEKNRGVFVRTLSAPESDEIFQVRGALERLIVEILATHPERTRNAGFEALLEDADQFARQSDFDRCHRANVDFHDLLASCTGNRALLDNYRRLVNELSLFRHRAHAHIRDASSLRDSVSDHHQLLAAIQRCDIETGTRIAARHLEKSQARMQNMLKLTSRIEAPLLAG